MSYGAELPCQDEQSNLHMGTCMKAELKKADEILNKVYQKSIEAIKNSDIPKVDKAKFLDSTRKAERYWVKFKETECRQSVPYDWYGGTHMGMAGLICEYEKTVQRAEELRKRFINR